MRILVLSDLHSNATALDAVLDAVKDRWDISVCLGDVVGYGPDPNEVTARLRKLATHTIRGNHDKAVTGLMPTDDFNPVAKSAVDWTRPNSSLSTSRGYRRCPPDRLRRTAWFWSTARFKMKTNTSSHLRRPLTVSWTPPHLSLSSATRITKAGFPTRMRSSRYSRFTRAPANPLQRSVLSCRAVIS